MFPADLSGDYLLCGAPEPRRDVLREKGIINMKTIYRDEIYEVIAISPMDEDNSCQVSLRSDRTGRTLAVDALCHDSPGCAEHPLAFIRMGLSDRQTLALIREFDTWYANTGQDLRDLGLLNSS